MLQGEYSGYGDNPSTSAETYASSLGDIANDPIDEYFQSVGELLKQHGYRELDSVSQYCLTIDRSTPENLWMGTVAFYKRAKAKPELLRKDLCIQFEGTGECGSDGGALRREFFEDALKEANSRLLEGDDRRRIMKKDWAMEPMYEIMGMIISHLVLLGGPGLPCLSPCMYQYMCGHSDACYPTIEDTPLNLATYDLIKFIQKVLASIH